MEPSFVCRTVRLDNGARLTSVCMFNNGLSHIAVDDACWVIINAGKVTAYINRDAMEMLMRLPHSPNLYEPYMDFVRGRTQ